MPANKIQYRTHQNQWVSPIYRDPPERSDPMKGVRMEQRTKFEKVIGMYERIKTVKGELVSLEASLKANQFLSETIQGQLCEMARSLNGLETALKEFE